MKVELQLSKWQKEFIEHFDDDLFIVKAGVGAGKSRIMAIWLVLQCMKNPDMRCICIAQNYRALTKVLFREILNVSVSMGINVTHNKSAVEIEFPNKSIIFGYSAENPDSLLGLTEISILCIDEAAYCSEEIYNNARDRMRGSKYKSKTRLISSPVNNFAIKKVSNYFSELCKKYPEQVMTVSSLDNPFTTEEYKNELKERYVEGSNLYNQQILGEILDIEPSNQIIFRKDFVPLNRVDVENINYFGYDAAGLGSDRDVMVIIDKFGVKEVKESQSTDTFEKVAIISDQYKRFNVISGCADGTGGYSSGVTDVLKQKGIMVTPVNFAQSAYNKEEYPNARTEMYLEAIKAIKEGFYIPPEYIDEFLVQEAFINNKGQLALVPKDLIRKALTKSPDVSDSIALAIYSMNHRDNSLLEAKKAKSIASKYLNLI